MSEDLSLPLLVGLNNPYSSDPRLALYPYPTGSTGHRILTLLRMTDPKVTREQYLGWFARMNVWAGRTPPKPRLLREAGRDVLGAALGRTDAVLLGNDVWAAVMVQDPPELFGCVTLNSMTRFWRFPHPSGRNPLLNDPKLRRRFGEGLLGIARGAASDSAPVG